MSNKHASHTQHAPAPALATTDLAEVETRALAVTAADMESDAGGGFEDANKDAYAIPFLLILQKGSPQIDTDHPKFKPVAGAVVGGILNTVTEEVYGLDKGVRVFPCHYLQQYVEWVPRGAGGGIVNVYDTAAGAELMRTVTRVEEEGKIHDRLPNGNDLVDTRMHYVLVQRDDGTVYPAVMSMSITQTKKSKKWMSTMNDAKEKRADGTSYTPPMWSRAYRVKTEVESKGQNTWRGWSITTDRDADQKVIHPSAELYHQAKLFRDAIRAGKVKTTDPVEPGADGDIPF